MMLQHSADNLLICSERRPGKKPLPQAHMLLHEPALRIAVISLDLKEFCRDARRANV